VASRSEDEPRSATEADTRATGTRARGARSASSQGAGARPARAKTAGGSAAGTRRKRPAAATQVLDATDGILRGLMGAGTQGAPRSGAKRTVMHYVRQLPAYVRLLVGLAADRRVTKLDKLLVLGAVAYIVAPLDWIPDFIPFLGEVDDVYLLVLALQRLVSNAGRAVVLDHWQGDPTELADLNLRQALAAAAFFLPQKIRRRLKLLGRV